MRQGGKPKRAVALRNRVVATVLVLTAFLLVGAQAQAQDEDGPSSLQGEFMASSQDPFLGGAGQIDVTASCTPTIGGTFTLTYSASGFAFGPYTGTFTETGTVKGVITGVTGDAFEIPAGVVTEWKATFSIDSIVGKVTGEKVLNESVHLLCAEDESYGDLEYASALLDYEAKIKTATGTFTDTGESSAVVLSQCLFGPCTAETEYEFFFEDFLLSTGVLPLDTSGKATGGGQIGDLTSLGRVTFGFEVKKTEDPDHLQGRCLVNDPAESTRVKCLTVTDYQQVGNTATWEGEAEVNGVREDYRITVQDNGEPNRGIDTFSITTESYEAAGNVTHGNVQLHKQQLIEAL